MEVKTIVFVDAAPNKDGWYRITASDEAKYITKDMFVAAVCQRSIGKHDVQIWSIGGTFTRRITHLEPVPKFEEKSA